MGSYFFCSSVDESSIVWPIEVAVAHSTKNIFSRFWVLMLLLLRHETQTQSRKIYYFHHLDANAAIHNDQNHIITHLVILFISLCGAVAVASFPTLSVRRSDAIVLQRCARLRRFGHFSLSIVHRLRRTIIACVDIRTGVEMHNWNCGGT